MEADGAPSLSAVCPVSWFGGPLAATLVLDPEAEHSLDIILVGSSECHPHHHLGLAEVRAH